MQSLAHIRGGRGDAIMIGMRGEARRGFWSRKI